MNKEVPRITLICLISALISVAIFFPHWINDQNRFLKGFLSGSYLSVLGTVTSITVASCTNIYIRLGQLEASGKGPFVNTKKALRKSAFSLIFLFAACFFILVIKGVFDQNSRIDATINIALISGIFFFCSVMLDITRTAFALPSQ